jgi:alkaline phosphatase D
MYMWDDHDYGPNDSDATAPGRTASRLTYQEYVPHYPLPTGSGDVSIQQSFTNGRVRFLVPDLRSERTPNTAPDGPAKSMMGAAQKEWFKQELLAANADPNIALIVWVSTVPWIADENSGNSATVLQDTWGGFATERAELARFLEENQIDNLVMLSGDAHMTAIDDGTNNRYGPSGEASFPIFHAGPLDRVASSKGGPYTHGPITQRGMYGLITVTDDGGDVISVRFSGRDMNGNERLGWARSFDAG